VAATLAALQARFDVTALGADTTAVSAAGPSSRTLRRLVPARIRGARRDLAARAADRTFAERALRLAERVRPDVIYERSEYMAEAGRTVADRLGIPLVLEVNGLHHRDAKTMYRSALEPLGGRLEQGKLRRADAVVTVSPGLADLLVELGAPPDRLAVVPNTVPDERVVAAPRVPRPGTTAIGWIGHVMDWHADALLLLAAAAPRVLERVDARFVVVGDGPRLEEVRRRVDEVGAAARFEFTGVVPYSEVPAALEPLDLGVIPEVFPYAFPVKLVELGAAGLPVVAPRSPSLDRQLAAGVEYQPFEGGGPEALADVLVETVRDEARRARQAAALHRAVRERFTWSAASELLERIVSDVVRKPR
jgi:glycosyltransferase involved in cell wall biosynthesis